MHDPIADMLTRIRNAYGSRRDSVAIPYSKVKVELAKLLSRQGLVGEVKADPESFVITVGLRYNGEKPGALHLRRISRPGLRVYRGQDEIKRVRGGLGTFIVSTSHGLKTGEEARKEKLGGEVIAEVW